MKPSPRFAACSAKLLPIASTNRASAFTQPRSRSLTSAKFNLAIAIGNRLSDALLSPPKAIYRARISPVSCLKSTAYSKNLPPPKPKVFLTTTPTSPIRESITNSRRNARRIGTSSARRIHRRSLIAFAPGLAAPSRWDFPPRMNRSFSNGRSRLAGKPFSPTTSPNLSFKRQRTTFSPSMASASPSSRESSSA